MAVQKSKKSRSKRGHRRSHKGLKLPNLYFNKEIGKFHLYHHIIDLKKNK